MVLCSWFWLFLGKLWLINLFYKQSRQYLTILDSPYSKSLFSKQLFINLIIYLGVYEVSNFSCTEQIEEPRTLLFRYQGLFQYNHSFYDSQPINGSVRQLHQGFKSQQEADNNRRSKYNTFQLSSTFRREIVENFSAFCVEIDIMFSSGCYNWLMIMNVLLYRHLFVITH